MLEPLPKMATVGVNVYSPVLAVCATPPATVMVTPLMVSPLTRLLTDTRLSKGAMSTALPLTVVLAQSLAFTVIARAFMVKAPSS